jgi:hypothetical protein
VTLSPGLMAMPRAATAPAKSRAKSIHRPDRDGLLTLLASRTASLCRSRADIPCTSLLTSEHRKRNLYRNTPA